MRILKSKVQRTEYEKQLAIDYIEDQRKIIMEVKAKMRKQTTEHVTKLKRVQD